MPDIEELVKIDITKPLPETGVVGVTYKIEGTVKMFDAIGAPPWVYAEVRRKEWWKPEIIEEVSYERGFPMPVTGTFSIDITPEEKSDYEVTLIATPAPLSLPVVGLFPVVGKSDMVKIRVAEPTATDIRNIEISVIGLAFPATDLKNIAIGVIGPEFPSTDLRNIAIGVIGPEFPSTDLRNIAISVKAPPALKGTISKKELEYNESRGAIPVSNVPHGKRGKVHVWGRNDETTNQKFRISWVVRDPDGIVAESYSDWQTFSATPGGTHEFISPGRFDLNKSGPWTIEIGLFMNPAFPVMVDSYSGVLCTVGAPPAEYTLEVTVEPPATGHVLVSPRKATYSAGEVVTLTAYPYSGYEFDHWGGWPPYPGIQSTLRSIQITMTDNWWVVAAFQKVTAPPEQCPLSVSASPSTGGSVTRSPNKSLYDDGEMIDVTAIANPGWAFDKFTGDGWETRANPVHVRGCRTTSVTAHFIQ